MIDCDFCGEPFEPVRSRWNCPHCSQHNPCCDGAPQPAKETKQ